MKRKEIYILYTSEDDGRDFIALAEDGTCLSPTPYRSQSEDRAKSYMLSTEMQERYRAHYPEGWTLVWKGGPINADTMASRAPQGAGSAAFISDLLYRQFLRALTA